MKPSRMLRDRVAQKRVYASLQSFMPQPADTPDTFHATSGESRTEIGAWPYLPHHDRPTVGFTPNP